MMKQIYSNGIRFSAALVALSLAACSGSGTKPDTPTQANLAASVLQLNVGTANLFGLSVGTNVVVTFRQAAGQLNPGASAALVSSPTLTVPSVLAGPAGTNGGLDATITTGPAATEIGTTSMTSTPQTATTLSTFGIGGGAFGLGLEPFNYGIRGKPDSTVPYPLPLYDTVAADENQFLPIGGLPAFDPAGNVAATAVPGVPLGLDVFMLAPAVGTYSLAVAIPANTGTVTSTASAPISSLVPLPTAAPPVPTGVTATGGATLTYVLPAGVTEGYVEVEDIGPTAADSASCLGASPGAPVFYTFHVTASGTVTLPAGSFCTAADNNTASGASDSDGDAFALQTIGFDYPAFEISYPSSLGNPAPSVVGAGATHQADITVSTSQFYSNPGTGAPPVNITSIARKVTSTVHTAKAVLRK
jgi:hypothetical protein